MSSRKRSKPEGSPLEQPKTKRQQVANNEQQEEKKQEEKFQVQGVHFFLTYPQCSLNKVWIKDHLTSLHPIVEYIVAEEDHKDGEEHRHVYLHTDRKLNIRNPRYFDIQDPNSNRVYHPNIQKCRNEAAVKKYCTKEESYITNIESFKAMKEIIDLAKQGKIRESFNKVAEVRPEIILMQGRHLEENLRTLAVTEEKQSFQREDFKEPPNVLHWEAKYKLKKCLWLFGPTNTGKTTYAKSLFKNPLLVRHRDQLKSFRQGHHDGIVFDDMSFNHWPRDSVIHLIDIADDSGIDVKHAIVVLPKGTPRVFTSNKPIFKWDETGAIKRRIFLVRVEDDLRRFEEKEGSVESGIGNMQESDWIMEGQVNGALSNITRAPHGVSCDHGPMGICRDCTVKYHPSEVRPRDPNINNNNNQRFW